MPNNLLIHLMPQQREAAVQAMLRSGKHSEGFDPMNTRAFVGPHFKGEFQTEVDGGVVAVTIDGVLYVYPLHTVARIKAWTE